MMTYKNGDVLELLKKYMAKGRKSGKTEQDEASDNASDAPDSTPDNGYG